MNNHYIGMRLRATCSDCSRIFLTQIIDKIGNTKNTSCQRCKRNRKYQIENGYINENDIFIPDWDEHFRRM